MSNKRTYVLIVSLLFISTSWSQQSRSFVQGLTYNVEMQTTVSSGDNNPLWLNANKYGLSSIKNDNGYIRGGIFRPLTADSARQWRIGYGLDVATAYHFTSTIVIQQAFIECKWHRGVLTVGSKEQPMELKNNELSSGSQTLGINARPIPEVRISLPDYYMIPGSKGWLSFKGHIAYGNPTDDKWQHTFTDGTTKYTKNTIYHSKAGYVRIGKEGKSKFNVELGLEMACIIGGTSYNIYDTEGNYLPEIKNGKILTNIWNAFIPGSGKDATEKGVLSNAEGDHLGSYLLRINWNPGKWKISAYSDHFFEDHSSMFLLDYNGYGTGVNWNKKEHNKFILYDLKDIMLGVEVQMPTNKIISNIVCEYLYTKYQSGPIYHDHSEAISDHIGGDDNYYNHSFYTGWQHWGQVIGNPLYRSPLYNTDRQILVENNRFIAWHVGINGNPVQGLYYKTLITAQKGWGTYDMPFADSKKNISMLIETTYQLPKTVSTIKTRGWSIKGALAFDRGALLGDNLGFQFSIIKNGVFTNK